MSSPAICASHRVRTHDWANLRSGWGCIRAAAVRNAFHILLAAAARSKSFWRERLRWRHRRTIRVRQPGTSGRGAGRLRRRVRAPDRVFRSTSYRGGEESHKPSLVAIRRPAPRRPQRVSDRADVARSAAANPSSVKGRTPTGRRLREAVACAARHAPRDVIIVWRSAASPNWQINRANHHNIQTVPTRKRSNTVSVVARSLSLVAAAKPRAR